LCCAKQLAAGKMGETGSEAVPDLVRLLQFSGCDFSWFAAESLGNLGPRALESVPALREAARSSDRELRDEARKSLKKLTGSEE